MTKFCQESGQRRVALVYDILNCGPRNRFVANGKLIHNSGGDGTNPQNLPRGGALREAICPPEGYTLVACDSSQIEARTLAWFAGQTDLIKAFANGEDIYSKFASSVYGKPINKHEHPEERHVGKTCLAADTEVLTNHGWKRIMDVTTADLLWDGEEWVKHNGVIEQGTKSTLSFCGITATPDHLCWTGTKFEPWQTLIGDSNLFQSALSSASLPCSDLPDMSQRAGDPTGGNLTASALAAGKDA